jgi:hypothetical protein
MMIIFSYQAIYVHEKGSSPHSDQMVPKNSATESGVQICATFMDIKTEKYHIW